MLSRLAWQLEGPQQFLRRFRTTRAVSLRLIESLSAEDQCVQSMPDASPAKWHLAHTTWFLETVVLRVFSPSFRPFDPQFDFLFHSYYESLGSRHPRPERGMLTRPSLERVLAYRKHIDAAVDALLDNTDCDGKWPELLPLLELCLQHEQQHQELLLTDIKHLFSMNPLTPAYQPEDTMQMPSIRPVPSVESRWMTLPGGIVNIGHVGPGFAFDNESPTHVVLLQPYKLAKRLVTCGEYLDFICDGG